MHLAEHAGPQRCETRERKSERTQAQICVANVASYINACSKLLASVPLVPSTPLGNATAAAKHEVLALAESAFYGNFSVNQ
jgi:hypothetical protein